jgi:tetraacyldisaccharide-1-P 4'-kinase
LPAGWLREPVESLKRAHAAVVTHAEAVTRAEAIEIETRLWDYFPNVHGMGVVAVARHEWVGLGVMGEEGDEERPVGWLRGKRVFVACAIGNPGAFIAGVRRVLEGELAAETQRDAERVGRGEVARGGGREPRVVSGGIVGTLVLRDHAEFGPEVLARLMEDLRRERADVLLVTEKDWSKLMGVEGWPCPAARPRLEMRFERGGEELERAVVGCVERVLAAEDRDSTGS